MKISVDDKADRDALAAILARNGYIVKMAASTIIHVDGKKYMPDTMYTIGRDGKVYEKE